MGKSPGKWIKTVLFGKKSSKSNISKDVSSERKISSVAKAPSNDLVENPSVVFEPAPQTTNRDSSLTEYEAGVTNVSTAEVTLLSGLQGADGQGTTLITSADSDELNRQHQAATKAQAAFRGYLARRAFWALKGIIRLQALVRGHLVRRQAVATLQCMHAIVKFQALVRGRIVRQSDVGHEVYNKSSGEPVDKPADMLRANMFFGSMKQSSNPFVRKLLSSSPVVMPLSLQYDLGEPNSAWMWLERWSSSRFWIPLARPKKIIDAKPKRKQASPHAAEEIEAIRPKRSVRKIPAMNGDSGKLHSSEHEKPKRNARKSSNHQSDLAQEQPQSELEKVKRNLRKVTSAALVPSDVPEAATEKPQNTQRKTPSSALLPSDVPEAAIEKLENHQNKIPSSALEASDVPEAATDISQNNHNETPGSSRREASEQVVDHSSEKPSDLSVALPTETVAEAPPESLAMDEPLNLLCENLTAVQLHSSDTTEKVENSPIVNEDPSSKEDKTSKEIQKRRRKSTPVKQESPESVYQNSPTLPSYMQATKSAKAKLRAQEAQRFGDDEAENGFTRRHSLPASTNVKLSTPSPRMQKPQQTNGKGGSKSNRSLTSSRDDKSLQAGWRR